VSQMGIQGRGEISDMHRRASLRSPGAGLLLASGMARSPLRAHKVIQ
jgi:hypothetical protein